MHTGKVNKKSQHYLYPQRKSGGRIHQIIMILNSLRVFYLVQRINLLTLKNLETRGVSKPFSKDAWDFTMSWYPIMKPHAHPGLDK